MKFHNLLDTAFSPVWGRSQWCKPINAKLTGERFFRKWYCMDRRKTAHVSRRRQIVRCLCLMWPLMLSEMVFSVSSGPFSLLQSWGEGGHGKQGTEYKNVDKQLLFCFLVFVFVHIYEMFFNKLLGGGLFFSKKGRKPWIENSLWLSRVTRNQEELKFVWTGTKTLLFFYPKLTEKEPPGCKNRIDGRQRRLPLSWVQPRQRLISVTGYYWWYTQWWTPHSLHYRSRSSRSNKQEISNTLCVSLSP